MERTLDIDTRQAILGAGDAYQKKDWRNAARSMMMALGIDRKNPLTVYKVAGLTSSDKDDAVVRDLVTCSVVLINSSRELANLALTPGGVLGHLIVASNIRDVVYRNPLVRSRLLRSESLKPLLADMAREAAFLPETAAPLYYGHKKQELLTATEKSLQSISEGLSDPILKCQTELDRLFFRSKHDGRIDKDELRDGMLEKFRDFALLLQGSDPKLLAIYLTGLLVIGERLSIDDLIWSNLRRGFSSLPKPDMDEWFKLAGERWREASVRALLPAVLCNKDFRIQREGLYRSLI